MISGLVGIDPGPVMTAWARLSPDGMPEAFGLSPTEEVELALGMGELGDRVVVEMVASYGMAVGATVFETCVRIGRLLSAAELAGARTTRIFRLDVKVHLCKRGNAKDANIRQALLDRFGPPGTKKAPGALYGVRKDIWAALAVAVTAYDKDLLPCP